ncbi:hypothetical protein AN189_17960 [Loktanella sp. 3ANDIMAR09]|uniref:hypothetical protein n=1 Tax=Loktanella sp. 3ANDIMAR09 TaxID=1225657 RepID=UPI0006F770CD|nr:hypothetical protein [Loktanella sp. 3ANDIMAR09]KQI66943.1 hypothetical protein AN189_17960 [Loktanella sp. 3ANDIMAR09]
MTAAPRRPMSDMPHAQQAGILCNDIRFRRFADSRTIRTGTALSPSAAAEFLRRQCQISSRRDLDTDTNARDRFDALRTEFDAWRGLIAAPRN